MRRALHKLLAISIIVPVIALSGYGYYDYQRRLTDAQDVIDRLARVADEQAVKVLDLNREMYERVLELLDESNDMQIRSHEAEIHQRLKTIAEKFPQVAAISVFGKDGDLLASSRLFPVPALSVRERDDFRTARYVRPHPYFSLPHHGATGTSEFATNMARSAADGRFIGVLSVALRQQYFSDFYRDLVEPGESDLVGLYRLDGGILIRYPDNRPAVYTAANPEVFKAISGIGRARHLKSTSTVDGVQRLLVYRRVDGYPLIISAGIATATIYEQWLANLLTITAIAAIPTIAVCLLFLFSLRRLSAEQVAWEQWRNEVTMRLATEASSRHLQRMGSLGNLVANVAHDFNNLLMVVDANMELASRKGYTNLRKEVEAVQRASRGAKGLARKLMSVARKQPLRQVPVELRAWIEGAQGILNTSVGDKVTLSVHIADDIGTIRADPAELESALINIAVNAKDAMPRGGKVVLRCQNRQIAVDELDVPAGFYVVISLTDNGEGMSTEVLRRAFEPLYTTKAEGAGTGLGLAQVLTACEQAGGTAKIESVPGFGTTVKLFFPRYDADALAPEQLDLKESQPQTEVEKPLPREVSVLLVEDNDEVAAGIAAVLEVFGCTVRHETTADSAMLVLGALNAFDVVLSDIQMPGKLSGLDLAEQVRTRWPKQKIALMTGYANELERAKFIGVTILAKPFDIDDLKALITPEPD
ncbi:ATP-binding protein [Caballeronia sp. LjRoot29]|uniref:hybrid sensor histidine kinase/response regulator n=1 Tax=Caballeronia sp. LjRoot29 TaxID=3342315 RepID=UPI003ECF048D